MFVTLNIKEDKELRNYIKDMIRGQVTSIVRDEIKDIVRDELNRKIKGKDNGAFDANIKKEMKSAIVDILRTDHNVTSWNNKWMAPAIIETITPYINKINWEKSLNDIVRERILQLAKAQEKL